MSEAKALREAKAKREAELLESEREDLKYWGKVMLDNYTREAAPYNAVLLSEAAKKSMWRMHVEKQMRGEGSVESLARRFGVSVARARAVLVLQGIEQHRRETGRWVGDAKELNDLLPPAVVVVDGNADSSLDAAVADVPARTPLALVRGEIDELDMQRIFAAQSLSANHAAKRAARFPELVPPGVDFTVRSLAPPFRRTLRGHTIIVVDTSDHKRGQHVPHALAGTAADPRFHGAMTVHERDGAIRTASLQERRDYFALSDRKPPSVELEPLEQIRKYVLTPVYYRGKPLMRKRFAEYERAFLEAKTDPAAAAAAAAAAASPAARKKAAAAAAAATSTSQEQPAAATQ